MEFELKEFDSWFEAVEYVKKHKDAKVRFSRGKILVYVPVKEEKREVKRVGDSNIFWEIDGKDVRIWYEGSWSKRIPKDVLESIYKKLPDTFESKDVLVMAKNYGINVSPYIANLLMKVMTDLFGGDIVKYRGRNVFVKKFPEDVEYAISDRYVLFSSEEEKFVISWEDLKKIFDELPKEFTERDVVKSVRNTCKMKISKKSARIIARFFDVRAEFDCALIEEPSGRRYVKGAESEKVMNLQEVLKQERELTRDFT